ncbi:hypothetical protein [uncultured Eubacterium sp.]|nr:hypothetical protein [uncultured Eubacterium sp.]
MAILKFLFKVYKRQQMKVIINLSDVVLEVDNEKIKERVVEAQL